MSSTSQKPQPEVKNGFQIPKWAGKPPSGLHLDVMKDGKMFQKLMIDEKNCYFFGRNKDTVDFVTDHASCSRVHAALVWHKHLNRTFIIDLGSAHGTFIGSIKLDANKPQQVFIDSELKFGASTRTYIVRERPQANKHFPSMLMNASNDSILKEDTEEYHNSSLNLPENEAELDNLTEFNTAHNKRITQLVENTPNIPSMPKKKKKSVSICDEEDVINPEDIDPSVGRFRNMVQTTFFIPNKKKRPNQMQINQQMEMISKKLKEDEESRQMSEEGNQPEELYSESDEEKSYEEEVEEKNPYSLSMGINLAPDVDNENKPVQNESEIIIRKQQLIQQQQQQLIHRQHQQSLQQQQRQHELQQQHEMEQQQHDARAHGDIKKKYAKEAWPGRKPGNPQDVSISIPSTTVYASVISPTAASTTGSISHVEVSSVSPQQVKTTKPSPQKAPKRLII